MSPHVELPEFFVVGYRQRRHDDNHSIYTQIIAFSKFQHKFQRFFALIWKRNKIFHFFWLCERYSDKKCVRIKYVELKERQTQKLLFNHINWSRKSFFAPRFTWGKYCSIMYIYIHIHVKNACDLGIINPFVLKPLLFLLNFFSIETK